MGEGPPSMSRRAGARTAGDALSLVDAHQHFWDPSRNYYPWLNDEPPIPFRYGDYRPIRRRYLPPDYRADAAPYIVEKSVYVEAEWDPARPGGRDALHRSAAPRARPADGCGRPGLARSRRRAARARSPGGVPVRAQRAPQAARQCVAQRRRARRHDRREVARRVSRAGAQRLALRPADAVVASCARRRGSRPTFPTRRSS